MIGRSVPRTALSDSQCDAMYEILARHFTGVERAQFLKDLDEKNRVILVEHEDGQLVGFSTLLLYEIEHEGESLSIVCSGDTIVDRSAWGSNALARAWLRTVFGLEKTPGSSRLLWLLIVSGFRTYRFLPVFFREFYPRHDRPASANTQTLVERLARERFGHGYDAKRGIVRFTRPQRLLPDLAQIPKSRLKSPHVAFFERMNPGHTRGDELVCLTELSQANLTSASHRMLTGEDS
jgi:hypothetical protein